MSDGKKSDLPKYNQTYSDVKINPPEARVRKVEMIGSNELGAIIFYDEKGNKIL